MKRSEELKAALASARLNSRAIEDQLEGAYRRALEDEAEEERKAAEAIPVDRTNVCTTDAKPFDPELREGGQQGNYHILCDEERAKGFVRPVRTSYRHVKCGTVTTMGSKLAETYARDPKFYGGTFCAGCQGHFPVGEDGEFEWMDGSKVGS